MLQVETADPRMAIGPRIGAAVIDIIILGVLFAVLSIVSGGQKTVTTHNGSSATASSSFNLRGWTSLLFVVLALAYYTLSEGLGGQTLGKRLLGVRVVRESGERCGWSAALMRNLLRLADGLPLFYLVGFIAMLASKRAQRLGDMAAKTVVIRSR